jgi:striatin 1/3/4
LTSPQAMNPLPNRPLLNNATLPLTLPNVPSFEQMPYNGRPRKVMPEAGKDFPLLNGMSMLSGPSSAPASSGGQIPPLDRGNPMGSVMHPQQIQQPPTNPLGPMQPQQNFGHMQSQSPADKDKDSESEPRQLTAIFRPDDAGEWKEKLRLSHEAAEQARMERLGSGLLGGGTSSWERRRDDDEDVKDEEPEVDEEDSTTIGEGDGNKIWRAKRTLRKSGVNCSVYPCEYD